MNEGAQADERRGNARMKDEREARGERVMEEKNRMNDEKVETGAGGERESAGERERSRSTREEEEIEVKQKQRDYADRVERIERIR